MTTPTQEDVIRWARESKMHANTGYTDRSGKHHPAVNALSSSVPVEWLERFAAKVAAAARRENRELELMAECMGMVRLDLIHAGIIDKSVPPMMVSEAVIVALRERVAAEREACAQMCDDRSLGDNNREDAEARRCARAIRARGASA